MPGPLKGSCWASCMATRSSERSTERYGIHSEVRSALTRHSAFREIQSIRTRVATEACPWRLAMNPPARRSNLDPLAYAASSRKLRRHQWSCHHRPDRAFHCLTDRTICRNRAFQQCPRMERRNRLPQRRAARRYRCRSDRKFGHDGRVPKLDVKRRASPSVVPVLPKGS